MASITIDSAASENVLAHDDSQLGLDKTAEYDEPAIDLKVPRGIREHTYRLAARMNAAYVSDAEYKQLLSERKTLIEMKYHDALTAEGAARLEYVRWTLDRIEDAKHGFALDRIEDAVNRYRHAVHELQELRMSLAAQLPRPKGK